MGNHNYNEQSSNEHSQKLFDGTKQPRFYARARVNDEWREAAPLPYTPPLDHLQLPLLARDHIQRAACMQVRAEPPHQLTLRHGGEGL